MSHVVLFVVCVKAEYSQANELLPRVTWIVWAGCYKALTKARLVRWWKDDGNHGANWENDIKDHATTMSVTLLNYCCIPFSLCCYCRTLSFSTFYFLMRGMKTDKSSQGTRTQGSSLPQIDQKITENIGEKRERVKVKFQATWRWNWIRFSIRIM